MSKKIVQRIGVYCIRNMIDGKCYVGQSARLDKRKREHWILLLKGSHHCTYLQRAFNKHGEECFEHIVLEECSAENMKEREQFWMDHFRDIVGIYNLAPSAGSQLGIKRSPVSVEKVAASKRGKKLSDETRKKMSISAKNNSAAQSLRFKAQWADPISRNLIKKKKGSVSSDETKAKLSAGLKERWANDEYKTRLSELQKIAQGKVSEKATERMLAKWADPEFREMMIQARLAKKKDFFTQGEAK